MNSRTLSQLKAVVFVACLYPLAHEAWVVLRGEAINPIEFITRSLGTWTLTLLLITLAITPLRRLTGWQAPLRFRRMLGLFTFFYVMLHFLSYVWLDKFFDLHAILKDIGKRPFITVGFLAFLLLIPLAVTSTDAMMRRLKRQWGRLHRLIYPIAICAVLHYWWLVKRDETQPAIYAAILTTLLAVRIWWAWRPRLSRWLGGSRVFGKP